MNSGPLVSIVVITYNSESFVLETLESAKRQTYKEVELIISDDGSSDGTILTCKTWVLENATRFSRTEIITVPTNTGIPANCNRGVSVATGEWIKLIAGDDILHDDCILLNMRYVNRHNNPKVTVVSDMIQFNNTLHALNDGKRIVPTNLEIFDDSSTAAMQHRYMLRHYIGNSPSLFISKAVINAVPFDESIWFMEDRPFAINSTKAGFKFMYLPQVTVYYRISNQSVYASKASNLLYNDFYKKRRAFVLKYIYPNISKTERLFMEWEFRRLSLLASVGLNKNNLFCKVVNFITYRMLPHYYFQSQKAKKNLD